MPIVVQKLPKSSNPDGLLQKLTFFNCTCNFRSATRFTIIGSWTLGPLLFLAYINDMCNSLDNLEFLLFADDINVFFLSGCDINELYPAMNSELTKITNWCASNILSLKKSQLSLSVKKTVYTLFHKKKKYNKKINNTSRQPYWRIGDSFLSRVDNVNFLESSLTNTLLSNHIFNTSLARFQKTSELFPIFVALSPRR